LFWLTKQTAKEKSYKYYWTVNGQIFVRKDDNLDKIAINCEANLSEL